MIKLFFAKHLYTIIGVVFLALLAALGVQTVRLYSEKQAHSQTKFNHATTLKALSDKTAEAYKQLQLAEAEVKTQLAAIDKQHYEELSSERKENERLRAAVRAGTARVRIKGDCKRHTNSVPKTASTRSVGNGATTVDAQLSERVLNLREQVIQAEKTISYLQGYALVCQKGIGNE